MKYLKSRRGFTLLEMLIVVAIIAILVAIMIPTLSGILERSRETTDLANVRSAYAELMIKIIDGDEDAVAVVNLTQTQDDWQSPLPIRIADVTYEGAETENWIGTPGAKGTCEISFDQDKGVIFTWSGGTASAGGSSARTSYSGFGAVQAAWGGNGSAKTTNTGSTYYVSRMSTDELVELEPNSTYTLTYTVPSDYTGNSVEMGTLLYTDSTGLVNIKSDKIENGNGSLADSGWISSAAQNTGSNAVKNYQTVTTGDNGETIVTQTITTDDSHVWFGANFRVGTNTTVAEDGSKTATEVDLTQNPDSKSAVVSAIDSLTITKTS